MQIQEKEQNVDSYDDEINLLEYWQVLMKRKKLLAFFVIAATVLSVILSFLLPNMYRAETVLAPATKEKSAGGASALFGQFGGLASMVGISPVGGSTEVNLAVLKSRSFIKGIVKENKLMPLLFPDAWDDDKKVWIETATEKQPTLWDAYRLFEGILQVSTDKKTTLTTVSLEREKPEEAAKWLKIFIETLNAYLRAQSIQETEANIAYLEAEIEKTPLLEMRQTLYSVIAEQTKQIMLAKSQKNFAFKIIDAPEVPDQKFKPKRSLIVIVSIFISFFLGIFIVFFLEYIEIQKDKESEKKV